MNILKYLSSYNKLLSKCHVILSPHCMKIWKGLLFLTVGRERNEGQV